jgi:hypothetical protein
MNVDGGIDPSSSSIKCLWPFFFWIFFLNEKIRAGQTTTTTTFGKRR